LANGCQLLGIHLRILLRCPDAVLRAGAAYGTTR
jgi:hypothetical protein